MTGAGREGAQLHPPGGWRDPRGWKGTADVNCGQKSLSTWTLKLRVPEEERQVSGAVVRVLPNHQG